MFFFTGVAFAGVVADLVAGFAADLGGLAVVLVGVGPVPVGTVLAGLETPVLTGVLPVALSFLGIFFTGVVVVSAALVATGVTFLVAAVPAGFEALLTAVFPVDDAVVAVFFKGVAVVFADVDAVVVAGFESTAATGALRTGSFFCVPSGVLGLTTGEAVLAAFFTGGTGVVFDAADVVALAGVETVFFVAGVLPAVLATLLTLARRACQLSDLIALLWCVHCSAPVCFLRSATMSVILNFNNTINQAM